MSIILILGMGITAFASNEINDRDSTESVIKPANRDYIINTDELNKIIDAVEDNEKKQLLCQYFYQPMTLTITSYSSENEKQKSVRNVLEFDIKQAEQLANLTTKELRVQFNDMVDNRIYDVLKSENVFATKDMYKYLEKTNPLALKMIENKVVDYDTEGIVFLQNERNWMPENSINSIVSKYYYRELSYNSLLDTVLRASCEVNWKYDNSTNNITSLVPYTEFWYTGASPITHLIGGWMKNTKFINGDRGFVQKGREILIFSGAGSRVLAMFRFNLVFSAYANNTDKTLLNDTGVFPVVGYDPTDWGGGY